MRVAHEALGLRGDAHVGAQRDRRPAHLLDLGDDPARLVLLAVVVHRHVGALAREAQGDGLPDAAGAAGHERLLAFKSHRVPPFCAQPANASVGRPATPTSRRSTAPASGCAAQLGVAQAFPSSRHVQIAQLRAPEAAAGDPGHRQAYLRDELAVGRVGVEAPAAVERDPDAALGVDGQAVRDGALDVDGGERPPVLDRAGRQVAVEDVDAPGRAVDEVEAAPGGAPAEAVRDRGPGEDGRHAVVGVDPIERGHGRALVERHRAHPQPPQPRRRRRRWCACRSARTRWPRVRWTAPRWEVQAVGEPEDDASLASRQGEADDVPGRAAPYPRPSPGRSGARSCRGCRPTAVSR